MKCAMFTYTLHIWLICGIVTKQETLKSEIIAVECAKYGLPRTQVVVAVHRAIKTT